ncbi:MULTISPECIES: hypothetical protein [unclassified Aurantimonas]|uniref:hypothetical protein n=1 Tax=unclassified Aurantimonas TaxID=2638230 RepID=UPI002E17F8D8|nr:hypothetical protein [Aurantimonas sp. A3-2-R12]
MEIAIKNNNRRWMMYSALAGLAFFMFANFTNFFSELNVISGIIQIGINLFVFTTWLRGFLSSQGRERFIAFFGVAAPPILAAITTYRVIGPYLLPN